MIPIDLSKQQAHDADPKAIQQINFKRNLNRGEDVNDNTIMLFITEEAKLGLKNFLKHLILLKIMKRYFQ